MRDEALTGGRSGAGSCSPGSAGWSQQLAGIARPGSRAALEALAAEGVRVLVNLGERPLPADELTRVGLRATEVPVADFTAPTPAQLEAAVGVIEQAVAAGRPVAVCCGAGTGPDRHGAGGRPRPAGPLGRAAVAEVRARRPGSVETPEQEAAVAAYARARSGAGQDG